MVQFLMYLMAAGAVLGGLDRILGNRFGLGEAFEEAFRMLGPIALSMAGIICLAPVLADVLGRVIAPLYHLLGQDPAMFSAVLALDMGGYDMAVRLADSEAVGQFAGIVAGSLLGCTLSFTIPTGMGLFEGADRDAFAKGILYGLVALPLALFFGALLSGIAPGAALWLCVPVILIAAALMVCLTKAPEAALKGFKAFAAGLKALTTLGLALGAFQFISGITVLPSLTPLEESMQVIAAIGVTLLGAQPLAVILQRVLARPMDWLGRRLGIGGEGVMGFLLFYLNATPGLMAIPKMNRRGQIANAAFAVCAASCLTAHFAFTMNRAPALALPLLVTKLLGGILGAALALWREKGEEGGSGRA
ncbi:MAG: ethanolamine utilization protein EutH [Clostridia bacterium]|nr:ethanolamine utilization protein EutH [Clostridia bacterium]